MNRQFAALILALALFSGCSQLPVYKTPAAELNLQQRRAYYSHFRADLNFWDGFTIGGNKIAQMGTPASTFSKYALASGDEASAAKAKKAELYNWIGLVAGLSGVAGGIYSYAQGSRGPGTVAAISWVLGGITAELVLIEFGKSFHFKPAIKSFNEYLKRDLGLDAPNPGTPPEIPR